MTFCLLFMSESAIPLCKIANSIQIRSDNLGGTKIDSIDLPNESIRIRAIMALKNV